MHATIKGHSIPAAIGQCASAIAATQAGVIREIRTDAGGVIGLFTALFDGVKGFAAEVHDLAEHLFEREIVLTPESVDEMLWLVIDAQ